MDRHRDTPRFPHGVLVTVVLLCGTVFAAFLAARQGPAERFDMLVRSDMFAGMAGDNAAMDRAMKLCEDMLAKNPENPEVLVWHGTGLVFLGSQAIHAGDFAKGKPTMARGLREMDDAVAKLPDQIEVLIPRGASLLEYSKHDPSPDRAHAALEKALGDYEKVLALQKSRWAEVSLHSRGELLSGLAEGWLRAGDAAKARVYMERLTKELAGSRYAARAHDYLSSATPPDHLDWHCLGCHVSSKP
jgi:hypothetical protein